MAEVTNKLYSHPLAVSNAALKANVGIARMHRSMKDVVLVDSGGAIDRVAGIVSEQEGVVLQELDIVRDKIIGVQGQNLEKLARELFLDWKTIRSQVIMLAQKGKTKEAALITMGKGAAHVAEIEKKMQELTSYARDKASGFKEQADHVHDSDIRISYIFIVVGVLLSGLVAFFTIVTKKEAALMASERMLGVAQQVAMVGSWEMDLETREITWSHETYRQLGLVPGEIVPSQKALEDFIHPDDREMVAQKIVGLVKRHETDVMGAVTS